MKPKDDLQKEFLKHKIASRKHGGDDNCSWAVFRNKKLFVTGLSKSEVPYYKRELLKLIKENEVENEKIC